MDSQLIQIRDNQKEIWNRFSPGWKKWDELNMNFLKPLGDELIRLIKPKDVNVILDIASGTGEPGITIASMLKGGLVVISDLAEGMIDIAREKATVRGIKNLQFVACDVTELPFPDNSFDSISCRLGFMFFPDMLLAAKEMVRVLKPGGRIATAVWNMPEKNFWATAIMSNITRNIQLPATPPGAPGLFRCANCGFLTDLFKQAGLKNISEREIRGKMDFGSMETYWSFMTEVVAPVVAAMSKADDSTKSKIKNEVFNSILRKYPDGKVDIDSSAIVIYGEK
jgi:ubiquinone/menaquinone biosynthesis C-methylase UbiE